MLISVSRELMMIHERLRLGPTSYSDISCWFSLSPNLPPIICFYLILRHLRSCAVQSIYFFFYRLVTESCTNTRYRRYRWSCCVSYYVDNNHQMACKERTVKKNKIKFIKNGRQFHIPGFYC